MEFQYLLIAKDLERRLVRRVLACSSRPMPDFSQIGQLAAGQPPPRLIRQASSGSRDLSCRSTAPSLGNFPRATRAGSVRSAREPNIGRAVRESGVSLTAYLSCFSLSGRRDSRTSARFFQSRHPRIAR